MKKLYYYATISRCKELNNDENMRDYINDYYDSNDRPKSNYFTDDGKQRHLGIYKIELSESNSLLVHKRKFKYAFNKYLIQSLKEILIEDITCREADETLDDIIQEFYLKPSGISINEFNLSIDNIKSNEKFKDKIKDYKNHLEVLDIYFECNISKSIKLFEYLKQQHML